MKRRKRKLRKRINPLQATLQSCNDALWADVAERLAARGIPSGIRDGRWFQVPRDKINIVQDVFRETTMDHFGFSFPPVIVNQRSDGDAKKTPEE